MVSGDMPGFSDRDILIDLRARLMRLEEDVKFNMAHVDRLDQRVVNIEKHIGDMPGRFLVAEGPNARRWDNAAESVEWFERIGRWLWTAITVAAAAAMSFAMKRLF